MFVTSRGRTMMTFFPAELPPFLQHKVVPQRYFDFLSHTSMMETFALFPRLSICFHVFISFSICFHVAMFPDYRDLELFRRLSTVATSAVQGIGRVRKNNPFEKQMKNWRNRGQTANANESAQRVLDGQGPQSVKFNPQVWKKSLKMMFQVLKSWPSTLKRQIKNTCKMIPRQFSDMWFKPKGVLTHGEMFWKHHLEGIGPTQRFDRGKAQLVNQADQQPFLPWRLKLNPETDRCLKFKKINNRKFKNNPQLKNQSLYKLTVWYTIHIVLSIDLCHSHYIFCSLADTFMCFLK